MPSLEKKSIAQRLAEAKVECAIRDQSKSSDETEAAAASSDTSPVRELDYPRHNQPLPPPPSDGNKESLHDRLARAKEESALQNAELQRQRQALGLDVPPYGKKKDDMSR